MSGHRTFALARYYVIASFLTTAIIGITLTLVISREIRNDLLVKAKDHAVRVIEHLQEDVRIYFIEPLLSSGVDIDLENDPEQLAQLDAVVRRVAAAFDIRDLYIFDRDGRILFSTQHEHIGATTPPSNDLFRQAIAGEVASAVRNRGTPLDLSEESSRRALLETYVPVISLAERHREGGTVANVIETYQDIDQFQKEIAAAQWRLALGSFLGGGLLFVVLLGIVLRADRLIRDQTEELVASNAQLTGLSRHLEQEVENRTRQLIQKEKLASLGTLAAGLAHEVNNPLATISTCAQALRSRMKSGEPTDTPRFDEYLAHIEDESFRVKRITESLLDFSRQKPDLLRENLVARTVVEETLELLAMGDEMKDVDVCLDGLGEVSFLGDGTTIKQLFLNLIQNAVDAIRDREELAEPGFRGRITWSGIKTEDQIEILCEDNGTGFEPQRAGEFMEPFATTKDPGRGTGLGLALCHSMAERLGARIRLSSEGPGLGARVSLYIPTAFSADFS